MVSSPRRFSLLGLGVVLVAWLCVIGLGGRSSADFRIRARAGTIQLDSVIARAPDSVGGLARTYLERVRLGLGSPFRLIDQAVHDPRLDDSTGRLVAWSILDRLFDRTAYEIDAAVLDDAGPAAAGSAHLALIDQAIDEAKDPRLGERVVRLAYSIAASAGYISPRALPAVIEVVAQRRDRALAQRDLDAMIDRVQRSGDDLIDEIVAARSRRQFAVESPLLAFHAGDEGLEAVAPLVERVERVVADPAAVSVGNRSLLPAAMASLVGRMGARLPPVPAITLVMKASGPLLRADSMLLPSVRSYLGAATNEEGFVSAFAIANRFSDRRSVGADRVALSAAVSLRILAQDPVWFPGTPAPAAGEIIGRFGLRSIEFDRDVPGAWRPYYIRLAASAIEDFQRVFPGYEPTGLSLKFVTRALSDSALAMHDPRTHALLLSIGTAPGALAHELAHDLDWQSARRLFPRGGGYATDRSAREMSGPLAASVRGLSLGRTSAGRPTSGSSRPAEVFARSVDWFVVDGLSSMGRMNAGLSMIQDPLLAGFAAGLSDAASLTAADALLAGLTEMTSVSDSTRVRYVERWGDREGIDPLVIVARLRAAPMGRSPRPLSQLGGAPQLPPSSCMIDHLRRGSARDRLVALTVDARARGIILRRAASLPAGRRPPWAHAALGEPTWSRSQYDEMVNRTIDAVIDGASRAGIGIAPLQFCRRW